jgi:hypothetical protein
MFCQIQVGNQKYRGLSTFITERQGPDPRQKQNEKIFCKRFQFLHIGS